MKERNYLFDNIKALLIFFVVIAHYLRQGSFEPGSISKCVYVIAFCFIMEGFFFVAGYFSKNVDKRRSGAVRLFIVPYFIMSFVMFFIRDLCMGNAHLHFIIPTHGLWYLLVMFAYSFFIKNLSRVPMILPISAAVFLASGFIPIGQVLSLQRMLSYLVFFIMGYKANGYTIEKIRKAPKWTGMIAVALSTAFAVWFSFMGFSTEHLSMRKCFYEFTSNTLFDFVMKISVGIISLIWIFAFINLVPERKLRVSVVGANTLTIFLFHISIHYVLARFPLPYSGTALYYLMVLAITLASLYVFGRPAVAKVYNMIMNFIYDYTLGFIWKRLLKARSALSRKD